MAIKITKPAMAARPLSCSAYWLNPFLGRSSLGLMEGLMSVTVLDATLCLSILTIKGSVSQSAGIGATILLDG